MKMTGTELPTQTCVFKPEKSFKAVADYYAADFAHDKEESHPGNTTCDRHRPDRAELEALHANLDGGSSSGCAHAHAYRYAHNHPGAGAFRSRSFGHYDLIDFVAVLIGYILSGEPTLFAFYERLTPFAEPFMTLFGRDRLPHRSTLSRFLAALDHGAMEALRTLFYP